MSKFIRNRSRHGAHIRRAPARGKASSVKNLSRRWGDLEHADRGRVVRRVQIHASFPITALISVQHDLVGKPDSTFPDHALISAEHDLVGKPDSTFPDHALKRAIRR
jgi:hypothetical protein